MQLMKEDQKPYLITFLRHGESVGNANGYFQGQSDFPLTRKGQAQVTALIKRWQDEKVIFDLIITSPLSRAYQTAEMIASSFNIPLESNDLWMERDNGDLAGLTHEEGNRKFPQPEFSNIYRSFGSTGEGDWELYLRAGRCLHELLRREPGKYLVVSHGGLLNQVLYSIMGITPQPNYSGTRFRFVNTGFADLIYFPAWHRWQVETINDHAHWKDAQ